MSKLGVFSIGGIVGALLLAIVLNLQGYHVVNRDEYTLLKQVHQLQADGDQVITGSDFDLLQQARQSQKQCEARAGEHCIIAYMPESLMKEPK